MTVYSPGAAESLAPLLNESAAGEGEISSPEATRERAFQIGRLATQCTAAVVAGNREDVIKSSAGFVEGLLNLWADQGVDPAAVWVELHCRTEMGELCFQLSRVPGRLKKRRAGAWRIATSKLP
ncbi:nucleoside triphosphate pyrophosphohydrolase family protein [Acetobacter conturbans]|uniref:Phosphoribosyl-ATP pyrophosphatase n=1 Tax=Acetobacter conturbans TaxID=1737472 RepID=A0ABX0JY25_9PROT|nr:phosphoribosyl-ATP pyrophosphatase [Acetobacter conturbans]NHN88259.1 phosphoribosyl-ATP pyrophosphatase [Acetobacter conturbans]